MNVDNENVDIDPVTDLGLALGYSRQCIQRRLNNDSGAGANAGSGLNMTFVSNNPLSELVWSPHKGPSNVALLPAQGVTGSRKPDTDNNHAVGDYLFLTSIDTSLQMTSGAAGVMPVRGPRAEDKAGVGGDAEEINTAPRETDQKEDLGDGKGVGISGCVESRIAETTETGENQFSVLPGRVYRKSTDILSIKYDHSEPDEAQSEPLSEGADRNVGCSNYSLRMDLKVTSEANHMNESEAPVDVVGNQIFQGRRKSFEKIESTAENDLQNLKSEYVFSAANDTILRLEFSPQVKGSSQQAEDMPPESKTVSAKNSPTNSRVDERRRKGKEKAISDGMLRKDDEDSHESVESCNSAGLFPTGKRRRSFDEDLVVGTQGFKKQIHHAHGSTSYTRQDSSFMNWISNMMKGFPQSVQEEAPFPLSIAGPDVGHENLDKNLISTINKNQDPGSKIIGFQSIFQSLYCAKAEVQETRMLNVEYQVEEGSRELVSSNKMSNNNSTPGPCQAENSNLAGKQFLVVNERFNESTSGNREGSAVQPKTPLDKFADSLEKCSTNSEENKSKCQLAFSSKEKERTNSNSSLGKRKTSSAEQVNSGLPSTGKTVSKFCHRNDSLGSNWITRFAAKIPSSSANPDNLNPSVGLSRNRSLECLKIIPHAQNHIGFHADSAVFEARDHSSEDQPLVSGKELQMISSKITGHDDPTSTYKLPFSKLDNLKPSTGNKESLMLQSDKDGQFQADVNSKADEITDFEKNKSSTRPVMELRASSSVEKMSKENRIMPLSSFVSEQNPDVADGLFDAVKRLRLSRRDIMKWKNSRMSLSQLDGFFLRLRLGKWEEGLGGTGYHVACIIGTQGDNESEDAKSSILVKVGGIKCLIESRFVSNNDFLEDELMAWWSITSRNGDKIPSEEDMRVKVKTKRMLGF